MRTSSAEIQGRGPAPRDVVPRRVGWIPVQPAPPQAPPPPPQPRNDAPRWEPRSTRHWLRVGLDLSSASRRCSGGGGPGQRRMDAQGLRGLGQSSLGQEPGSLPIYPARSPCGGPAYQGSPSRHAAEARFSGGGVRQESRAGAGTGRSGSAGRAGDRGASSPHLTASSSRKRLGAFDLRCARLKIRRETISLSGRKWHPLGKRAGTALGGATLGARRHCGSTGTAEAVTEN